MKTIETIVKQLSDEELKTAFDEILEWRDTGVLKDGVVRNAHQKYIEQGLNFPFHMMENPILFEIAKRHFQMNYFTLSRKNEQDGR